MISAAGSGCRLKLERLFRAAKSLLETRPIFHQKVSDNLKGHGFGSLLALYLVVPCQLDPTRGGSINPHRGGSANPTLPGSINPTPGGSVWGCS